MPLPTILSVELETKQRREMGFYKDVVPFIAMVAIECSLVGYRTLFKAATLKGMSSMVFLVYSYSLQLFILFPCLFVFPSYTRRIILPSAKLPLVYRISILGLIGALAQLFANKGLQLTSPTLSSTIGSLTPAFTFIIAVIFRMESLSLRSSSTQAKIVGTIVSISGALVVILYKGPTIVSTNPSISLNSPLRSSRSDWILGSLLLTAQYILYTFWYILQTDIMHMYPEKIAVTFFYSLGVTIVSALISFIVERNSTAWTNIPAIGFIALFYAAICHSTTTIVHSWSLHIKGPLYVTMFKPLSIAIAAFMGFIFLGDALHLGSVVGAAIISIGFYTVLWGKAKEEEKDEKENEASSSGKLPLLQNEK